MAFAAGLVGTPNELKLKYLADKEFADLSGEELKNAISEKIKAPENAPADGETNNEDKPSSDEAPSDGKPEPKQENNSRSE